MLPWLHRLDPQVSKSKCLYNGECKGFLQIAIASLLNLVVNLSFCSLCGTGSVPSQPNGSLQIAHRCTWFVAQTPLCPCCIAYKYWLLTCILQGFIFPVCIVCESICYSCWVILAWDWKAQHFIFCCRLPLLGRVSTKLLFLQLDW